MSEPKTIRIFLVDDHAVVRSGLRTFLMAYDDFELVGEAGNGEEAIDRCAVARPDVVVMDLMMPVMDGAAATRIIRQRWPNTQVVALTSFKEEGMVAQALQAGAISYMLKNASADELARAIRAARDGQPTLAPEATQALINASRQADDAPGYNLTEREHEVLELMVEGYNNPEIAQRLIVSRSTVKFHVSSILSKLNVSSRTEAVAVAMKNGLVKKEG
jgi:two-component system, NarL family, response regulator LiaR